MHLPSVEVSLLKTIERHSNSISSQAIAAQTLLFSLVSSLTVKGEACSLSPL